MLVASLVVMISCLVGEGLILLISGFPLPGLPPSLYVVGFTWLSLCIATAFYSKRPHYAIAGGWILLVLTTMLLHRNTNIHHTALAFLYQHSLEFLFIVASHFGYFIVLRRRDLRRATSGPQTPRTRV